jgi:hypothetical protein
MTGFGTYFPAALFSPKQSPKMAIFHAGVLVETAMGTSSDSFGRFRLNYKSNTACQIQIE